jgi:magnesium transporter
MKAIETMEKTEKLAKEKSNSTTIKQPWFCVGMSALGSTIFKIEAVSSASLLEKLGGATISWVDYITQDVNFDKEALNTATQLGFSNELVSSLIGQSYLTYQDLDTEMGMKVPCIQVRQLEVEAYPLLLLLRKDFILTIHPLNVDRRFTRLRRYAETVLRRIPAYANAEDKLTLLLIRIIDHNNDHNFEHLRQIEEQGDHLNEIMTDPYTPRTTLGPDIYRMKHALITYLNSLWDTVDVLHTLRYGDAELITNDQNILGKISVLVEDVNRQIGLAEHMSEVLASGLEVLQSIYNNQLQALNNRLALLMTYLTIIGTAVLVPNTLATMLSNAVFDIGPKDLGWYLALMIGSTVGATALVYWLVRKRGWIPKRME